MIGTISHVLRPLAAVLACLCAAGGGFSAGQLRAADSPPALPAANPLTELVTLPYQPQASSQGMIRLAGSTTLQQAAAHWSQGFRRIHPQVRLSIDTVGSEAGWNAFREGKADIALLSRPLTAAETAAFGQNHDGRLAVVVAGFERLVWIVHPSNPVGELAWTPEGGVLRPSRQDGVAAAVPAAQRDLAHDDPPNWDLLNGDPAWKDVAIRVHGRSLASGSRWHMDRLLVGATPCRFTMIEHTNGAELAEAVAADRGSLGLVGEEHAQRPDVKRLPLLIPADEARRADAVAGSDRTPDCRPLFVAVAIPEDGVMPPHIREFMEYVLSYSGQLDVAKDGLLPLSRGEIHAQKELLGWSVAR